MSWNTSSFPSEIARWSITIDRYFGLFNLIIRIWNWTIALTDQEKHDRGRRVENYIRSLRNKWENPCKKKQQIAVCSYIKSDCIMPFKPKPKKLQSGWIIPEHSFKSIKNSQTAKNSKVIPHSRGWSPLTSSNGE